MQAQRYFTAEQQGRGIKDISHHTITDMVEDAEDLFVTAKERLLDVNNWNKYGSFDFSFALIDNQGKELQRHAHKGDYIRISQYMNINTWAYIEAIEYDDYPDIDVETFTLHITPSDAPRFGLEAPSPGANEETVLVERRGVKLLCTCYNILPVIPDEIWAKLMSGLVEFLQ